MSLTADGEAPTHYGRFERAQDLAAYEGLRELILSRRSRPGQRIDIATFTAELDVEPRHVQSALIRLASEYLVLRDESGAYVAAPMTVGTADALFDARTVIELGVIDAFIGRIDESDLAVLERLAGELASIVAEPMPDLDRFLAASHDYHRYLVGLSSSGPLVDAYLKLGISRLWRSAIADLDWWNLFDVTHHGDLTVALREGDAARAKRLVHEHQAQVKRLVRDVIAQGGGAL